MFSPSGSRRPLRGLRAVCAGFEECSPKYEVRREGFPYAAVELIAAGSWDLVSAAGQWRLEPGMIFTYGPGVRYSLSARSATGLRKYFVDFEGRGSEAVLLSAGLTPGVPTRLANPRWLQDLIEQLIDTARIEHPQREKVGGMLVKLVSERLRIDQEADEPRSSAASLTFERCREYLSANYLEIGNLALAAKKCGVTQVHLCRLWRKFAGETPHAFVTRKKMNHAAELIVRGHVAVKTAALAVGYPDPYHFSRVFKQVHGSAPSRFCRPRRLVVV